MKNRPEILALLALVIAAALFAWYRSGQPGGESPLKRAAIELNKTLPKPYVDGLVMEHAQVVGEQLVVDIRIPDMRLDSLDPEKIPVIRAQEQGDLVQAACGDAGLRNLLDAGSTVARHFFDQDRKLIFSIAVSAADCPKGGML